MQIIADLHTHTVASGHAYSTVQEMAQAAADKRLTMLGITEHSPGMPGGPHPYYFYNIGVIPKTMYGVRIIKGVETNIVDRQGNIDLEDDLLERLELVWAGFHISCSPEGRSVAENTEAMVAALSNPRVDGVVHPGNPEFRIEPLAIVQAAKYYDKVIELNNSSVKKGTVREGSSENCLEIAKLAKKYALTVVIGSDSHISFDVGRVDYALQLAAKAGLGEDDILNCSAERIEEFLTRRNAARKAVLSF